MKRISRIVLFAFITFIFSCSQKLYQPEQKHSDWVSENIDTTSITDLVVGRTLYIASCQTCHYLHYPSEFTKSEWDHVFPEMSIKANLSDANKMKIYNYIIAGAADTNL